MRVAAFMAAIRANCRQAATVLNDLGYAFEETPVSDPLADIVETSAMLANAGAKIPETLLAFYEIVGAVEFTGIAPTAWTGCQYSDPISVVPLDARYWRGALEIWDDQPDIDPDGLRRFTPQMSGDHIHKAGYSGGEYSIIFDAADPTIWMHDRRMPFTAYLRLCNAWGGFPGLQGSPDHTWPLDDIQSGFVRLPD
ncbi:MAG: hypothetical protein JNM59_08745 [Hyphomonadaceae bacterium]|nr:hypothetical protein [Hyphomonadaceae bacterium]